MLINLFAGLFCKRCALCRQAVREQGDAAVQRFGKWYCSRLHADLYELDLYEALRTVHCRHAGCHGAHVPFPEAEGMNSSPRQNTDPAGVGENHERCFSHLP
jgi:hypothetical protein